MKKQLQLAKFNQQYTIVGPLNNTRTVLLARGIKSADKQYIIKAIDFSGIETMLESMPAIMKRVYASNQPIIYKPQFYVIEDTKRSLLLLEQVFSLSLEGIILYHQQKKEPIDHWLLHNFACKLYDSINRIKNSGTQFYHRNLKPSNIFLEIKQPQVEWKITQFGLLTRFPNKYYQPITPVSIKSKTNISNINDQYENDLHALAVMLLEMITLTPINQIYEALCQNKPVKQMKNIKNAQNQYGNQVIDFIVELLKHRDNSRDAFQRFKDTTPEFKWLPKYQQTKIQWSFDRFQKLANVSQNPYTKLIAKLKKEIEYKNIKCEQIIKQAEKYDTDLQFFITSYEGLFYFMREFGIDLEDEELVEVSFMARCASAINYMDIFKECYQPKILIQAIIKTGIETFPTRKQFFYTNSGGRDFWSAEDITKYLQSLNIHIDGKQVTKVVEGWSGLTRRSSIKYQQFNKIFKGIGVETATAMKQKNKSKSQANEKTVFDVLSELKMKLAEEHKNLISFFRMYDKTNKWIVGTEIEKAIKNRINIQDKVYNQICEEMWDIAGVSNETKKILLYVKLLKLTKIYSITELFKLIVVEKINESSRQAVYRQFEKNEKGWNLHSLEDFNEKEGLDFEPRQINIIFDQIDKDKSGYLSQNQLIFSLTGLKQFDKDFIIQKIKEQLAKRSWDLFSVFMKFDVNKDLYLDLPYNLQQIFEYLEVEIPDEHCVDLFNNGKRNDKFPYMEFLRNFVPNEQLFVKACMFFIDYFYDGNFQKFYDLGRIKNKKKWGLQSFNYINEHYIMGFSYNQIGQIWEAVNPDKQQSLTKQEIAKIFNCSCEKDENILAINSVQKPKFQQKSRNKEDNKMNERKNTKQEPTPKETNKNKNDLIQAILEKKLSEVTLCFIKKSKQNGELTLSNFCTCLDELKIKYLRNTVMKNTSKFQRMDNNNNLMINFVNFLMFVCQSEEEGKEQRKAQCLTIIIQELMKYYELNTDEIFKKCKKPGRMRLTDYENFIRDLVKTDVYFDDLDDTWKYWGAPEYLSPQDFNKMTNSSGFAAIKDQKLGLKVARHFSFADDIKTTKQEPEQSNYHMKSRKSSKDSRDIEPEPQNDRNRFRGSFKEESKYSRQSANLPPKPTMKKNIQLRQSQNEKRYEKKEERKQDKRQIKKEQKKEERKQLSKAFITQKFENRLREKGSDALNNLFSRVNAVNAQQFAVFVENNYDMQPNQCEKLAEAFNSFGKVKIETMKKYIQKIESPQKAQKPEYDRERPAKRESEKREPFKKDILRSKDAKQPVQINQNLRLEDPRKMKINVPLVKQHIKILTGSFAKKFDVNQMEPYFFEGNTTINKQDFIKKCCEINSSISKSMYEKIFSYLKPKSGLVSSVSFKLSFSFDEDVQIEQTYLPEEIDREIKVIFEKSDKDNSGFIEIHEIQSILSSLGMNQTQKQIEIYFQRIDQNFDKKISLKEFKIFIEENILPYISDFDEDVDYLTNLLKMNDVFRTGYLPVTTIGAVLQRYGVKLGEKELNTLNRFMATDSGQISIKQLISRLYFPSDENCTASLKAVLYRIRWRRKITFKQIQKIFQNIAASFVMSYTSQIIKSKFVTPSTFITPILNESRFFYNDYFYKNFGKLEEKIPNLLTNLKPSDLVVEIKLVDASGIPIPQNPTVKNGILNRSVNVILYDTSIEQGKDCIVNLQVEFDSDVEDQWVFNKNNRSIFVKIANYEPRKYEKILVLFQFVVTMVDGQKCIDISCGSASFPVKELQVETKTTKRYKMIAGLPNKSKDIDKMSISKRKGWRGIIGSGQIESQFQIQIVPSSKFLDKIQFLAALPQKCIVNRKALHLFWTFREYFAYKSADQKRVNPDFGHHFIVQTFLLCLDIPDVNQELYPFWKQKIEPKAAAVDIARRVFHFLMLDLHIVINSKQFQYLPSFPSKSTLSNKTLKSTRKKLLQQVFANIQQWVVSDVRKDYRRKKAYNVDSSPFIIEQRQLALRAKQISNQLMKSK